MREITVSTEVFARIWSLRDVGEETENEILQRVLGLQDGASGNIQLEGSAPVPPGLYDLRNDVTFPEGFTIERTYKGKYFRATINNGQWSLDNNNGRYSKLNELSKAIGTKTENAWVNWYFIDDHGVRRRVSELRDRKNVSEKVKRRIEVIDDQVMEKVETKRVRWCDDVKSALVDLGGKAPLREIYREVHRIRQAAGRSLPEKLKEVVRKELEIRSSDSEAYRGDDDWFTMVEGKGNGVWAIRRSVL